MQFGLSHPDAGWPQVQSGPQVQGEQVQLGLLHSPLMGKVWHKPRQPVRWSSAAAAMRSSRARATRDRMVPSGQPATSAASA